MMEPGYVAEATSDGGLPSFQRPGPLRLLFMLDEGSKVSRGLKLCLAIGIALEIVGLLLLNEPAGQMTALVPFSVGPLFIVFGCVTQTRANPGAKFSDLLKGSFSNS